MQVGAGSADQPFVDQQLQRWHIDAKKRLLTLSPGVRQRLALVRALASPMPLSELGDRAAALAAPKAGQFIAA